LRAAKEAEVAGSKGYFPIVKAIEDDHIQAAKDSIRSPDILKAYIEDVSLECHSLIKILESAQHLEEVSHRAENKIISKGEKLACRYMAALLNDRDIPAQYVDLSDIIKDYNISTARDGFYQQLAVAFGQEILNCGDKVPIVTGYFGHVPGGLLHSIGRGYTDLCAALVSVGVRAAELQIWKEVDGIFTADPRKVPTARLIPSVTPSEAAELTFYGSEVIHPFTMEQVIRARIPIRIKNVMNPRGPGTVIIPDHQDTIVASETLRPAIFRTRSSSVLDVAMKPKRPTAVTIKHQIVVMNVHSNKRTRAHGFLASIFSILDRWHLSVDLIASSEVHVSMALHSEHTMISGGGVGGVDDDELKIQDERLQGAVNDLAELGNVDLANDMAIVSLVGKDLKNMTGISGRFFSVLGENNINIEMISQGMHFSRYINLQLMLTHLLQGASEINISCVIWARDADRALNVLHTSLFTFLE
jgi:aspartate kinase